MATTSKLSKIKKGEYFRYPGKTKVYQYDGKRGGKYCYSAADDASSDYNTATDRAVEVGFNY